jgi:hypothetical protein
MLRYFLLRALQLRDRSARPSHEQRAKCGEQRSTRRAFKERRRQDAFQIANAAAQRRL